VTGECPFSPLDFFPGRKRNRRTSVRIPALGTMLPYDALGKARKKVTTSPLNLLGATQPPIGQRCWSGTTVTAGRWHELPDCTAASHCAVGLNAARKHRATRPDSGTKEIGVNNNGHGNDRTPPRAARPHRATTPLGIDAASALYSAGRLGQDTLAGLRNLPSTITAPVHPPTRGTSIPNI
jgi:hypothetical protein